MMGYVLRRRGKWCQSTSFSARDVDRLTAEERDCTTPVCRADKLRDATSCRGTARRHVDRSTCGRFESTSGGRGPEVPRSLRHRAPDTGEPTPNTLSVACRRDRALRHAAVSSYRLSCLCTCRRAGYDYRYIHGWRVYDQLHTASGTRHLSVRL